MKMFSPVHFLQALLLEISMMNTVLVSLCWSDTIWGQYLFKRSVYSQQKTVLIPKIFITACMNFITTLSFLSSLFSPFWFLFRSPTKTLLSKKGSSVNDLKTLQESISHIGASENTLVGQIQRICVVQPNYCELYLEQVALGLAVHNKCCFNYNLIITDFNKSTHGTRALRFLFP